MHLQLPPYISPRSRISDQKKWIIYEQEKLKVLLFPFQTHVHEYVESILDFETNCWKQ